MSRYEDYVRKRFPKNIADTAMKYFGKSFAVEEQCDELEEKILGLFKKTNAYIDIEYDNGVYRAFLKNNNKQCHFVIFNDTDMIIDPFRLFQWTVCGCDYNKKTALEKLYEDCCGFLRRKYYVVDENGDYIKSNYKDNPDRICAVVKFGYRMKKHGSEAKAEAEANNN